MKNNVRILAIMVAVIILIQPACVRYIKPSAVLLFDESVNGFAEEALENLAIASVKTTNQTDFNDAFSGAEWDLVVFDNPNSVTSASYGLLYDYVTKGGRVVISSWQLNNGAALWEALGYDYGSNVNIKVDVLRLNKSDPLWRNPFRTTDLYFANAEDNYYTVNSQPGSATGTGAQFATFEEGNPAKGAVFVANAGRTILNAFLLDDGVDSLDVPVDSNANGTPDSEEWWTNQIKYVCSRPGEKIQPVMPASVETISDEGSNRIE